MTFPKEMLDLADQRARKDEVWKQSYGTYRLMRIVLAAVILHVIACILKP
jgi:hypothetical protein